MADTGSGVLWDARGRPRGRKRILRPVIVRAATALFARSGFGQTMDDVAKAAGVTKATLYTYFDSKAALIEEVVDQWLSEMPVPRPLGGEFPFRQQLIDAGLQLQKLASHPAAVSLRKHLAGLEEQLPVRQIETWRRRNAEFERLLAGLLERHCGCESPSLVAHQFLLLVTGELGSESAVVGIADTKRVDSAVELILRAYPERARQPVDDQAPLKLEGPGRGLGSPRQCDTGGNCGGGRSP